MKNRAGKELKMSKFNPDSIMRHVRPGVSTLLVVMAFLLAAVPLRAGSEALDSLSGEALAGYAKNAVEHKNWQAAAEAIEKWLKSEKETVGMLVDLGKAQLHLEDEKDAEKSFKRALDLDKKNGTALEGLLEVYLVRRKKNDMLKTLKRYKSATHDSTKALYYEALAADRFELKNYEETFFWDTLEDLVRRDPSNIQVLDVLCDAYINDNFFERGILFLNELLDSGGDHSELLFQLARIYTHTGDKELAREMFSKIEETGLENLTPRQRFLMARELFRLDEVTLACDAYFSAAREMDDDLAEEAVNDLRDITMSDEKKEFKLSPSGKKGIFLISFWNRKDPTPTTVKNERLAEHYRRIEEVKNKYHSPMRPGYDERGRVYIKHGEPDQKTHYSGNWAVRENESWLYSKNRSNPLIYHFVEVNNYYRMVYRLQEALIPDMETEIKLGARNIEALFRSRAEIHPKYDQLANEITRIEGSYQDARYGYMMDLFTDEEMLTERGFLEGEVTETFEYDFKEDPMNFYYAPVTLKGPDSLSALGVYFGLPTSQVKVPDPFGTVEIPVELEVVVFDSWWQEVARKSESKTYRVPNFVSAQENLIPDLLYCTMKPGYYHLAVRMKQTDPNQMQIYKSNLFVPSYRSPDSLYISDLVLAANVVEDNQPSKYNIRGHLISPMPNGSFKSGQPVYIYYELYNLKPDAQDRKYVKVEYLISSRAGSLSLAKKIISTLGRFIGVRNEVGRVVTTFEREIDRRGNIDPVYLSIDPTGYNPGTYNLMVTVQDSISGRAVSNDVTFIISD
ncbi:MAG: GWxTD domain-containing protein [Candidatus Glassbacteria bacterium]|nr:GWxTD domain-containing protein [Candidatus Glassbacteria bacterium]